MLCSACLHGFCFGAFSCPFWSLLAHALSLAKWIPIHCTTREVPMVCLLKGKLRFDFTVFDDESHFDQKCISPSGLWVFTGFGDYEPGFPESVIITHPLHQAIRWGAMQKKEVFQVCCWHEVIGKKLFKKNSEWSLWRSWILLEMVSNVFYGKNNWAVSHLEWA